MLRCLRLPTLTFGLLLGFSPLCATQADWLDQMDAQFESTFQQTDAAFDKAMRDGVTELDQELSQIWGPARALPEPKKWVGYSQDRQTRIIVDYEHGEMSIEGFGKSEVDLQRDFRDILLEDSEGLNQRAILRERLIQKTKPFAAPSRSPDRVTPPQTQRTEKGKRRPIIWRQPHELSRLIEPRARPVFISLPKSGSTKKITRLSIKLRKDRDRLSAEALRPTLDEAASAYALPRSLLLSMIKNESSFNPRARSHANALGLMQLVPTSGGKEAYSYLKGQSLIPNAEVLYDPHENIMLGATYLHLLNTRYFGDVTNQQTRRHLIIAAYNTGAGNVAKAFTGEMKLRAAIAKINTMTPDEVYDHLLTHLPYDETKTYLARVTKDTRTYADWDNA